MPADFLLNDDGDQFLVDELVEEALVLEEDGVTELELEEGGGSIDAVVAGPGTDFLLIDGGDYQLGLSDSVVVSDQFSRQTDVYRFPADTVSVSDSFLYGWDTFLPIADSVGVSDAQTFSRGLKLTDSVTTTDALAKARGKQLADTLVVRDGLLEIQWGDGTAHKLLLEGDAVSVTDRVEITTGLGRRLTQEPTEVVLSPTSVKARLSQESVDVLHLIQSKARVTQAAFEVIHTVPNTRARTTQMTTEVAHLNQYDLVRITWVDLIPTDTDVGP